MTDTTRYALPLLQSGQAQKEITHNEAVARIDTLLHLVVESRRATSPVQTPATAWIVAPDAEGDLAGHAGTIIAFDDSGPKFVVPRDGCIAFVRDEARFVHFAGGLWRDGWPTAGVTVGEQLLLAGPIVSVSPASGGNVIDAEVRTALAEIVSALKGLGLLAP